jgi:hypothetical protein
VPVADNTRFSLHRPSARRNESVQLLFWPALHTWIGTLAMLQEVSATHLDAAFEPAPAVLNEHRTTLKIASNIHVQLTLSPRTRYKCKIWCNPHHFAISLRKTIPDSTISKKTHPSDNVWLCWASDARVLCSVVLGRRSSSFGG